MADQLDNQHTGPSAPTCEKISHDDLGTERPQLLGGMVGAVNERADRNPLREQLPHNVMTSGSHPSARARNNQKPCGGRQVCPSINEAQVPTAEMAVTPPSIKKSAPTTYAESSDAR